ncbi:hypothetical protein [Kamptonema formosum]|uniref:hypothetical protein n=1 Tax=Kamptonema formosum TaxID=331992 RepID=UPI0002D7B615|nr:hypothetical protein [Kamptonema formosum]
MSKASLLLNIAQDRRDDRRLIEMTLKNYDRRDRSLRLLRMQFRNSKMRTSW